MIDLSWACRRSMLLALLLIAAACAHGSSATEWTNESRVREDALTSQFDVGFAGVPAHLLKRTVETSFPLGDGPRRPSAAAPVHNGPALIIENNSGRVFLDGGGEVRKLALDDRLVFPSALRVADGRFHVSDNEGLKSFG